MARPSRHQQLLAEAARKQNTMGFAVYMGTPLNQDNANEEAVENSPRVPQPPPPPSADFKARGPRHEIGKGHHCLASGIMALFTIGMATFVVWFIIKLIQLFLH